MAKIVVGLFDKPKNAEQTERELTSAGFGGQEVRLLREANNQLEGEFTRVGIPQADAGLYSNGVRRGGAVVIVQADDDTAADRAADIIDRHHPVDVDTRRRELGVSGGALNATTADTTIATKKTDAGVTATTSMSTNATPTDTVVTTPASTPRTVDTTTRTANVNETDHIAVPIIEEQIAVGKRAVERGGVRVFTRIEEVPVQEQVTLREEEVHVQRRPVDRAVDAVSIDQVQTGTFEIHERGEEAVVSKQAVVKEEVVINKEARERTETIQDTVRRTDVNVEQLQGQTRASGVTEVSRTSASNAAGTTNTQGKAKTKKRGKKK